MSEPTPQKNFEILKFLFSERMLDIRQRKEFDFKLLYSYAAMNLIVAGTLNLKPLTNYPIKYAVITMLFTIAAAVSALIFLNTERHKAVGKSLRTISLALGLYKEGCFIEGESIDSEEMKTHISWDKIYYVLIWIFFIAQVTIIFFGINPEIS